LREIFDNIQKLNACIWIGGGGLFRNAGLVICIASSLPQETISQWEKVDKEREQLLIDFNNTGIKEKLEAVGKRYFALSPQRAKDGSLQFFLNPCDQDKCFWGWVTLKDLEDWIQNKGKIILSAKEIKERRRGY
jgi:hypothetical protein